MIGPIVLAAGLVLGLPILLSIVLSSLFVSPVLGAVALLAWGGTALAGRYRRRSSPGSEEVVFLREVAASMASGTTLRGAIASSSSPVVDDRTRRLCDIGVPMRAIIPAVVGRLPETGRAFSVVADMAESVGSSIVDACQVLAEEAEASRIQRGELRVSTAQARFSALVVGVVPLVIALLLLLFRGIPEPGGAIVILPMVAGALLMVAGTTLVLVFSGRVAS